MVTLARKIVVPTLVLWALVASMVAFAAWQALRDLRELEERSASVRNASALAQALAEATRAEDRLVLSVREGQSLPEGQLARVRERLREIAGEVSRLTLPPRAAEVWAQYVETRAALDVIREVVLARARQGDAAVLRLELDRWRLMTHRSDALLADFTAYHLRSLDRTVSEAQARRADALLRTVLGALVGLLLVGGLSWAVVGNVVRPISEVAAAAEHIAETGRPAEVGGGGRDDEIGTLARAFNRMTERLLTAKGQLEDADRRKDEFLGMLSHELRNPLAPMRNALHILDRAEPASPVAVRAREVMQRQMKHLTRIVDDLLDVTRIARGKIELRLADVDLGAVVRRCGEDYAALMRERGVELVVRPPPPGTLWVHGDETRLAQLVGNLLQNAAKFTPRGGRVTLSAAGSGDQAELRVEDTGIGIDAQLLGRVFEPFTQAAQALARPEGGLGLGLAFVKGIAELHGGTATATSEGHGRGASFVVRLPAAAAPRPAHPAPRGPPPGLVRHVLVVDDNRDAAETLAELVRSFGHEVDVAHDGPGALALARARRPDLVLCDIGLPGMSGYDVARALRDAGHAGLRLVALSGYAQPADVERALQAGFDQHLAKPCEAAVIERLFA